MNKLTVLAVGSALVAVLAACSSSSGTSTAASHSAPASTVPKSGTETLTGQVTGAAAVANTTTFHLKFAGPVTTTGTFTPPDSDAKTQAVVFQTQAGDMAVSATMTSNPNAAPTIVNAAQCRFSFATRVDYTVDGAKSTGSFAGATGTGKATVTFTADAPKLSSGKCNMSQNAKPLANGAIGVFDASGPITVK
jgi:hypothetical protein